MEFRTTCLALVYVAGAALGAEMTRRIWPRRSAPGGAHLVALLVVSSFWSVCAALEAAAVPPAAKIFWSQASYLGILSVPPLLLCFSLRFAGMGHLLTTGRRIAGSAISAFLFGLVVTNGWHGLIWSGFRHSRIENMIVYERGSAFWIVVGWSYSMLLVASLLFVSTVTRVRGPQRRQAAVVLLATVVSWSGSAMYVLRIGPLRDIDLTPTAITIAAVLLAVAVQRLHLTEVMPVALERVFESLEDGILVLDINDRVLDSNQAARSLLGLARRPIVAMALDDLVPELADVLPGEGRIEFDRESPSRVLDVRVMPLEGISEQRLGRVVVFRDVTERRRMEDELARQRQELELMALTDPLTRLFNRRHADHVLDNEIARSRRYQLPFSLAILDIDHFKRVNDRRGHDVGDQVLRQIADLLRNGIRQSDTACRLGGEEFLVMFPHTPIDGARGVVERLRSLIENTPFSGMSEPVTVSAGVAAWQQNEASLDLLRRADAAMYVAKRAGRNRVEVAA